MAGFRQTQATADVLAYGKKPRKKLANDPSWTDSARNSVPCWLPQL